MGDTKSGVTLDRNHFFIGGEWVKPSSSSTFKIFEASTEAQIAVVPEGQKADIDHAVAAARKAFDTGAWRATSPQERAAILRRFGEEIKNREAQITSLVSRQNGMPIWLAGLFERDVASGLTDYYASLIDGLGEDEKRPSQLGRETLVSREPIGVVAAIVPWNYPVTLAMTKIAPALAAGCTLVIKPSPGTVLDSYVLAEAAMAAGIPAGVINWVAADREVGAYLVSHPGVDKVAFTGSTAAGRIVARECGQLLRPVTLELGGKSAAVVLDDADLNLFAERLPLASFLNNGQTCFASTRILAPRSRYKDVVDAVTSTASKLKVGNALEADTQIGPMASMAHRQRVESYIELGRSEGKITTGGGRPGSLKKGWFVEPTVFMDVSNDARIAKEEIFGPVVAIIPYDNDADAVRIANSSEFGLGGTVWGKDEARALGVAKRVNTGTIGINGYAPAVGSPFGGVKASGMGRELGPEALQAYLQYKSTYVM